MKKKYEKPQMFMESFEVAEFIASCEMTGTWNQAKGVCMYFIDGDKTTTEDDLKFFADSSRGCFTIMAGDPGDWKWIYQCYNGPEGRTYNVFSS